MSPDHRWEPFQRIQPINVKFLTTNFPLAISDEILESLGAAISTGENCTMNTPQPVELVFRHVDGIDISMDIYLPKETSAKPIPVILWWHGASQIWDPSLDAQAAT
ncbi:hypothetical protein EYR36_010023 [Pleurotus pulmonarius]|nr:hypothetical protein EYR36_010023 [Pleurotus pulmonarius]KAF4593499.1 hypothetical protein EYR38_009214 [Pleurotus pulmonarius]